MSEYVPTAEEVLGMLGSYLHEYGAECDMNLPGNSPDEIVDRWLAEVRRQAAEEAVKHVRNEIRGISHWWNTDEQRGGFDIPPLGPNASSEEGAFMEVMRVLDECAAEHKKAEE